MTSPNQITVSKLEKLIGTPACPVLIDVCIDEDFNDDPRLIPGAFRHPYDAIEDLVPHLRENKVVVVCQKGLKLSQGAAAILRAEGISAEFLEGGNFAWRDVGAPLVPITKISSGFRKGNSWVTRMRPKVDRIACPWLIRRFIDPQARFLFVSADEVNSVAERYDAIPFDVDEAIYGHREGMCSFDALLKELELQTEPLLRMAAIVRGADTAAHDLAPEVPGLLAISLGLSRMFKDDIEQVHAGMLIYDALYRWARDASRETHNSSDKLVVNR